MVLPPCFVSSRRGSSSKSQVVIPPRSRALVGATDARATLSRALDFSCAWSALRSFPLATTVPRSSITAKVGRRCGGTRSVSKSLADTGM